MNDKVRARTPYVSLALLGLVLVMTFGNAAANMIPFHVPTTRELQLEDQRATFDARDARIDELVRDGDRCEATRARELARGLVYNGRFAEAKVYAFGHLVRCGDDPVVQQWAEVTLPHK